MKPWFPKELFCRDDVAATVTRALARVLPRQAVEMGDSGAAHLDPPVA